ncbi:MAG: hypothetical protein U0136_13035 [Bdellovibrionota bacterium]
MERRCRETGVDFTVTEEDLGFYEKIAPTFAGQRFAIPPPTLCPEARMRRRLCFRNERTLYKRPSSFSDNEIISNYAPEEPWPVYEVAAWYSDAWDPTEYGRDYDRTKPFFEQLASLMKVVPVFALSQRFGNDSSPYTNLVSGNRRCHFIFAATENEDCFYSTYLQRCRDVSDCFFVFDSELCYQCIDCYGCYRLQQSQECERCRDSEYLLSCVASENCFGCISQFRQKYCLFNEQLSPKTYASAVEALKAQPDWRTVVEQRMLELARVTPRKYYSGTQNESFTGDHLASCRNTRDSYDCTFLEDCRFCTWLHQSKDCYDCYAWGLSGELGLENHLVGNNFYNVLFSDECSNNVSYLYYCRGCYSSTNLFGCVGIKNGRYCVLNKQYSKDEYERLVAQIISDMQSRGEWGEFFPQWMAPYSYNESVAAEYFPMTESEVRRRGWRWRSAPLPGIYSEQVTKWEEVTLDPHTLSSELSRRTFACSRTGRNFRYTAQELALYQKLGVSAPTVCFEERYRQRRHRRNPRTLFARQCAECATALESTYGPEREERILCETCYQSSCA